MKLFRFLFGTWPGRLSLLSVCCAVIYMYLQRRKKAEALRRKQIEKNRQESQRLLEEQKKLQKQKEEQQQPQQSPQQPQQSPQPQQPQPEPQQPQSQQPQPQPQPDQSLTERPETTIQSSPVQPTSQNNAHSFASATRNAPKFEGEAVIDGGFKKISSDDYQGRKVLLCFYPRDFSNFPFELLSQAENFRSFGCEVIFCNRDSKYAHFACINHQQKQQPSLKITTPLLSDLTGAISTAFGFDETTCHSGVFLISEQGKLLHSSVATYGVPVNTQDLLHLVQSLQN